MKKILSALMAVAMAASLTVVGFAASAPGELIPGETYSFALRPVTDGGGSVTDSTGTITLNATNGSTAPDKSLDSSNYTVSGINWTSGKSYIESVKINDSDSTVDIKVKNNYTMVNNGSKTVEGSFILRQKGDSGKSITYALDRAYTVGYGQEDLTGSTGDEVSPSSDINENLVQTPDAGYTTLTFATVSGDEVSVRVYGKEKFYLGTNADANNKVLVANADVSYSYLNFLNFEGSPKFSSNATIFFYSADEDAKIYELKDGKLYKTDAKWDDDNGCWTLSTKTPGSYVISDATLKNAGSTGSDSSGSGSSGTAGGNVNNPDTGANDVVGVAIALAVVSLISVAAISLKKKA